MPAHPHPSVLVVRFGSLGDVILTTPLLRVIRRVHPAAHITFVTKAAYAPILAHNPHLERVVTLARGEPLHRLAMRLRDTSWDHRLDLHGSLRARGLRVLLPGRWRSVTRHRVRRALLIRFGVGRHRREVPVAERYFEAAAALGVAPDGAPAEVFLGPDDAARAASVASGRYVVLAPGAAHATKRWPADHWRALASRLAAAGRHVVAVGLPEERPLLAGAPVTDAFGVGLGVTAALLQRAQAVVANDSGLMHMATAVGVPVVALFGPTVGAFGFSPYRSRAVVLERPLACRPCSAFGDRACPLGHHRCMIDIDPAQVHAALSAA